MAWQQVEKARTGLLKHFSPSKGVCDRGRRETTLKKVAKSSARLVRGFEAQRRAEAKIACPLDITFHKLESMLPLKSEHEL